MSLSSQLHRGHCSSLRPTEGTLYTYIKSPNNTWRKFSASSTQTGRHTAAARPGAKTETSSGSEAEVNVLVITEWEAEAVSASAASHGPVTNTSKQPLFAVNSQSPTESTETGLVSVCVPEQRRD